MLKTNKDPTVYLHIPQLDAKARKDLSIPPCCKNMLAVVVTDEGNRVKTMQRMHRRTTNHCKIVAGNNVQHDSEKGRVRRHDGILPAGMEEDAGLLLFQFKLYAKSTGCLVASNERLSIALPLVVLPTPIEAKGLGIFPERQRRQILLVPFTWLHGLGTFPVALLPWRALVGKGNSLVDGTRGGSAVANDGTLEQGMARSLRDVFYQNVRAGGGNALLAIYFQNDLSLLPRFWINPL